MPGGKVLIDFNRAYNPFCEFNEKYTCPFDQRRTGWTSPFEQEKTFPLTDDGQWTALFWNRDRVMIFL
jgi:hypothetical protein